MDVTQIRLANLKLLTDNLVASGKNKQQAAAAMDMGRSFHSQLLGGKKMGDEVARKIEVACKLPHGWMDALQTGVSSTRVGEPATISYLPSQSVTPTVENMQLAVEVTRYWIDFHGLQGAVEDHIPLLAMAHELVLEVRRSGAPGTVLDLSKKLAARLREEKADDGQRGAGAGPGGAGGGIRGRAAPGRDA